MFKAYIFLVMGLWLVVLPYLGFPYSWKGLLTTITGLCLIYFSYTFYVEFKKQSAPVKKEADNFEDSKENEIA